MQGVRVLLPVWGAKYLRQCLEVCIPSLLAPGNVPAITAVLPTTFVLMTRDRDMPLIRAHRTWLALAAVCDARLESIDGLLSEAASLVLTLAYAREIRALGAAACEIGFVFLVSDYIVADGALRHVLSRLQGGADAVFAGNFQMLRPAVDRLPRETARDALSVPPRDLVRLALDWLHPATLACMAGETATHDPRANRVFWRAGRGTLLGRFYLMHMVAIRPLTVDVTIAGPCDYSFVPEFCPDGRIETITDSDDYLVVEVQSAPANPQGAASGPLDPAAMAKSLAEWATAQHRRNAAHPIVYHDADTGPELAGVIDESARFVAETNRLPGSTVRPHRHHPYWAAMLDHHQATAARPVDWPALEAILGPGGVPDEIGGSRQRLLGRMPKPRPWHPHWTDLRVLLARIPALASGHSLLIVSAEPDRVRTRLMEAARSAGARNVVHMEPEDLLGPIMNVAPVFDAGLVIVRPSAAATSHDLLSALAELLADGAPVLLALSELSDGVARHVTISNTTTVAERTGDGLRIGRMETIPAPRWRIAAQTEMMDRARSAARATTSATRSLDLFAGIACAGLSLVANLVSLRRTGDGGQRPCSTALFHLVRETRCPPASTAARTPAMADTWTA
jgi:hypothetical protein